MHRRWPCAGLAVLAVAGCASQQARVGNVEQMLVAAGFLEKPADTPQRQQQLAALKPFHIQRQLVQVKGGETYGSVYPDPRYCRCLFTGDAAAYQKFRQIAEQQRIADERLQAAEIEQENAFDWGMWGPYGSWGGPPMLVVVPHHHHHHHH